MSTEAAPAGTTSRWIKCISTQGTVRGIAIQATDLVRELVALHKLEGASARGLGEAVMAGLLLGSYCKEGERVNLNVQGTGAFSQALVDAYPDGRVRGYVVERKGGSQAAARVAFEGDFPDGPWGSGLLSVLRTKDGEGERPYIGTVPLVTGHLAKDLTFYWAQSEQVPSSVGLVVDLEGDSVKAAGAFLIQAMPGASPTDVRIIDEHIAQTHDLAMEFEGATDPLQFLSRIFRDMSFLLVEERPLRSYCNCSWERVERALSLVGVQELRAMLAEDRGGSIQCDFCSKTYHLDALALERLIEKSGGGPGNSTLH